MADIAHIAGLIIADLHQSPIPCCHFVTSTTHKTLRGPRGGLILCKEDYARVIDKTIFPGIQGGPLMHVIAAKAVCFKQAMTTEFKEYQRQIIKNAQELANKLIELDYNLVSGGTDNHLMLVDLRNKGITGKQAEKALEEAGGSMDKAIEFIRAKGLARAEEKSDRDVQSGRVYCYTHLDGVSAAMVEVACETDFVAKTPEFETLCKEIAMQVVSMNPKNVDELLAQPYIRDATKTIEQLVKELVGKTGENIRVIRFARFKLGTE